jgi:trk system potassium uptake protein TrkA
LIAIISITLSPIAFNRLVRSTEAERERVLIVGCRQSGDQLLRRLRQHRLKTLFICDDDQRQGSPDSPSWTQAELAEVLQAAEIDQAKAVVAIEQNDDHNLQICRMARQMFGIRNVIAWVHEPSRNVNFRKLRVRIMNPAYDSVPIMESMVLNPDAFSISADVDETQAVREIKLRNTHYIGRRLNNVAMPGDVGLLMIERSGDILVPDRETKLRANDTITLVGAEDAVDEVARLLAWRP